MEVVGLNRPGNGAEEDPDRRELHPVELVDPWLVGRPAIPTVTFLISTLSISELKIILHYLFHLNFSSEIEDVIVSGRCLRMLHDIYYT